MNTHTLSIHRALLQQQALLEKAQAWRIGPPPIGSFQHRFHRMGRQVLGMRNLSTIWMDKEGRSRALTVAESLSRRGNHVTTLLISGDVEPTHIDFDGVTYSVTMIEKVKEGLAVDMVQTQFETETKKNVSDKP